MDLTRFASDLFISICRIKFKASLGSEIEIVECAIKQTLKEPAAVLRNVTANIRVNCDHKLKVWPCRL